jgi:hypothetical protein
MTDGVQNILSHILPPNSTDQTMTKTLLLWYIWKARNDHRYQRKVWTPVQVHHAATAHFNTNLTSWGISMMHQFPNFHPPSLLPLFKDIDAIQMLLLLLTPMPLLPRLLVWGFLL